VKRHEVVIAAWVRRRGASLTVCRSRPLFGTEAPVAVRMADWKPQTPIWSRTPGLRRGARSGPLVGGRNRSPPFCVELQGTLSSRRTRGRDQDPLSRNCVRDEIDLVRVQGMVRVQVSPRIFVTVGVVFRSASRTLH